MRNINWERRDKIGKVQANRKFKKKKKMKWEVERTQRRAKC